MTAERIGQLRYRLQTTGVFQCPHYCHRCPHTDGRIHARCLAEEHYPSEDFSNCKCELACYECGLKAIARCDWPIEAFVRRPVSELSIGDICQNASATRMGRILNVEEAAIECAVPPGGTMPATRFTIRRIYKNAKNCRIDTYTWSNRAAVRVLKSVACSSPACDAHHRDLIGGIICAAHWPAQLEAIA